jgi:predicted acyltransferase
MPTITEAAPVASVPTVTTRRLMSIDALRGFDMFWIIGANAIVYALQRMHKNRVTSFFADQLEHVEWAGFHFYDLIFPLFVFLMGVSLVFSLSRALENGGRQEALKRVFRRGILLFLLGIFYSGGFSAPWPNIRVLGVLNAIAVGYFFGGLLFLFFKPRALAAWFFALLLGSWACTTFIPIRDIELTKQNLARVAHEGGDEKTAALFEAPGNPSTVKNSPVWAAARQMFYATTNWTSGKFEPGRNFANHLDFQYLPGMKYDSFYDPEGLFNLVTVVTSCLAGIFAGLLLRNSRVEDVRKVLLLAGFGIIAAAAGWLWSLQLPVVKKLWSASFVLVAGGYSAILVAVFYLVVDIWQKRSWCQPFVWMGMNSITIYIVSNILGGFSKPATRLAGGDIKTFLDNNVTAGFGDLVVALVGLLLAFWFVRFLYKRQIFLRL